MKKIAFLIGFFCLTALVTPPSYSKKKCQPIVVKTNIRSGAGKTLTIFFDNYCRVSGGVVKTEGHKVHSLTDTEFRDEVLIIRRDVLSAAKSLKHSVGKSFTPPLALSEFIPAEIHVTDSEDNWLLDAGWLQEGAISVSSRIRYLERLLGNPFVLRHEMWRETCRHKSSEACFSENLKFGPGAVQKEKLLR